MKAPCPRCREPVSTEASRCPKCQADFNEAERDGFVAAEKRRTGMLLAGGAVALLLMGTCRMGGPDSDGTASASAADEGAALTAAFASPAVPIRQVFDEMQANEAAAVARYGGRLVRYSGVADRVQLDIGDSPELLLRTSNQFMSAPASFVAEDEGMLTGVSPGDRIDIVCEDLTEAIGMPLLRDCHWPASENATP